jgi:membrane protein implicated in regulation of membrane protease activity
MMLWQEWWIWIVGGIILGLLELIAPAFVLLGFAIGAIITGVLLAIGILGSSFPAIILVFALCSLAAWLLLRKIFGMRQGQVKIWDKDINDRD